MRTKRGGGTCTELRLSGGEMHHVAAEYSLWGFDVQKKKDSNNVIWGERDMRTGVEELRVTREN